jgi:hypothetical protein
MAWYAMRFISHVALVLTVFMVVAIVDAVPDPPAVTPHTVDLKVSCPREFVGDFHNQALTGDLACNSHAPLHRLGLVDAPEPKRSSDWIKLAGYAADSSPPVL